MRLTQIKVSFCDGIGRCKNTSLCGKNVKMNVEITEPMQIEEHLTDHDKRSVTLQYLEYKYQNFKC